jgi:hypothetical protein
MRVGLFYLLSSKYQVFPACPYYPKEAQISHPVLEDSGGENCPLAERVAELGRAQGMEEDLAHGSLGTRS